MVANQYCRYLLGMVILFSSNTGFACSCLLLDLEGKFRGASMVYKAKLAAAAVVPPKDEQDWGHIEGTFHIIETYKGKPPKVIKLRTGMGGGDCGVPMIAAHKYFIFQGETDYLGICGGSSIITPYTEDEVDTKLRKLAAEGNVKG